MSFRNNFVEQQSSTSTELVQVNILNQRVAELYEQGHYTEALLFAEKVLSMGEKALGPEHPDVAISLNNLAEVYKAMGAYAQAEPFCQRAVKIFEQVLGSEHPHVAIGLNNLAALYADMGMYAKAEPLYQRALAILQKALGPEHPDVATSLNNLAALYADMGMYAKAEPLYQRALAILQKALGPEHPDVATSLDNLAALYEAMGAYAQAEPLYQQALAIREKALGPEHPNVATSLNGLAGLYHAMGTYAKAEPLYQRALTIREKALGPEHPDVASSLNNLALLYNAHGEYGKAEPLYQRALSIREKVLGSKHPDVATSLNNLAALYAELGEYAKAEPLCQRALTIREKVLGSEHPHVAISLNNLAELYRILGAYTQAEPLCRRALAISEKVLGLEHLGTATSLNNLALLYHDMGTYAQAEPPYQRALAIREKVLGPEHPDVAFSLNNLAGLYVNMGAYAQAEPLYQRALAILEKVLGLEHPDVAFSLNNLAVLYGTLDRPDQAHSLFLRTQQIDERLIAQILGFTSEKRKLTFLATKKWRLDLFLNLVSQYLVQGPSARKDALDIWLRRKGVILEAQKRFQEALIYSDDPETVTTFQELSRVRAQLSRLVFAGPGKEEPEAYKERIAELEAQKEELEAKLSRLSQVYAVKQKIAKADVEKVAKALPANTALLEFARVEMCNFKAKGHEEKWNPAHYLVFILHAGNGDEVGLIDLGEADRIDRAVAVFKKQIARRGINERSFKALTTSSEQVYKLVFAPLQEELGEVKEIFISPDGNLNLIPFEVLIGPDGRFLIEEYTFNYLAAGRDILGFGEIQEEGNNPLLMGDPDFDFLPTPGPSQEGNEPTPDPSQEGNYDRSADMRGFHFERLSGARAEVEAIHALLGENKTALYTDKEALEEVLMQAEAPRILHLATHGFFLEDQDWQVFAQDAFARGIPISLKPPGSQDFAWTPSMPSPPGKFENPLLRSGIALAGANTATGEEGHTSGIVTAEKILGLKLRGTEMVVLSACETGLGDVQAGEGVFGLRRAFTQAGAKSLVMSLWAVPDEETKELMVQFYQNILSHKMTRCQALRQAALKQMQITKDRYGYPHPLYWGAFVFMGEP